MSTFAVPVVIVGAIEKHPNADSLSITEVEGCPCIIRTGDLQTGDRAVYIPVEAVVKEDSQAGKALSFLKFKSGRHRVKAVRLRGTFSMGIMKPLTDFGLNVSEGTDLAGALEIEKYEEPEHEYPVGHPSYGLGYADREADPGMMPVYDMESYRKYKHVFQVPVSEGQLLQPEVMDVVVTEKLHGTNARFVHDGDRLWVGSHRSWKKLDGSSVWNKVARQLDLDVKLARFPRLGLFGEVFGRVQDLTYGAEDGEVMFALFDVWDVNRQCFLRWDDVVVLAWDLGLQTVPVLYRGPMNAAIIEPLADGITTVGGTHIREGIVIKSTREHWNRYTGRTIAKLVSQDYLLRPAGTERH